MSDVSIDTTGMVRCGHPGCRWLINQDTDCPEHSDRGAFWADPDDPASVVEAKRRAARVECPYGCGAVVGHPDSPSCDRPTDEILVYRYRRLRDAAEKVLSATDPGEERRLGDALHYLAGEVAHLDQLDNLRKDAIESD